MSYEVITYIHIQERSIKMTQKESILKNKSQAFALRIIKVYKYLCDEQKEYILSKQVLRSGTSIGANIAEAFYAQSKADFIAKLHISRKEAGETIYWIELLRDASYLDIYTTASILEDCEELMKLLTSSIKTMKEKKTLRNS